MQDNGWKKFKDPVDTRLDFEGLEHGRTQDDNQYTGANDDVDVFGEWHRQHSGAQTRANTVRSLLLLSMLFSMPYSKIKMLSMTTESSRPELMEGGLSLARDDRSNH